MLTCLNNLLENIVWCFVPLKSVQNFVKLEPLSKHNCRTEELANHSREWRSQTLSILELYKIAVVLYKRRVFSGSEHEEFTLKLVYFYSIHSLHSVNVGY